MAIKARGSSWQADLTLAGIRYRHNFKTKEEARRWEASARAAVAAGDEVPSPLQTSDMQPMDYGSDTGGNSKRRGKEGSNPFRALALKVHALRWANTASNEKALLTIKQLVAYVGKDTDISEVDADVVDGFITDCIDKRNANGTINRKLAILSVILRFAKDRKMITEIPPLERRKEVGGRIRWLTQKEEEALLSLLSQWSKRDHIDAVTVLLDTGFRPGELYKLTPQDIDIKAGTITTWVNKTDNPRTVYMTTRVKAVMQRRKSEVTSPTDLLFPYSNTWMRTVWDRARSHLGYAHDPHFIPYICRHTCASRLVQRGVGLQVVKEWLGHKSMAMTMRYAHLSPKNLQEAAGVLETAE